MCPMQTALQGRCVAWQAGARCRLGKRCCVESSRCRSSPSAAPIQLTEREVEFLTTVGERTSRSTSSTPVQDAAASLMAVTEDMGVPEALPSPSGRSTSEVEVQFRRGRAEKGRETMLPRRRLQSGDAFGREVLLKIYPPACGSDTDLLVKNEIAVHTALQQLFLGTRIPGSERMIQLLGHLTRTSGEQIAQLPRQYVNVQELQIAKTGSIPLIACVVRRMCVVQVLAFSSSTSSISVEEYCITAAEELFQGRANPGGEAQARDQQGFTEALERRKAFVKTAMVQVLEGLAFMHRRDRVHQKLEPRNVVLSSRDERQPELLQAQIQDLALAADISDVALLGGATLAELWQGKRERSDPLKVLARPIWDRAKEAGAKSSREQQLFAVSEDILAAGLLVAHLAFVPFCEPGSIDFAVIQRILGVAFQSEVGAAREYCEADDRWRHAVAFLNEDIGSGWDLIQSMIFPDYKLRPTAESCLNHPFLKLE